MKCATCGRRITPCPGAPHDDVLVRLPCRLGGYTHATGTKRAGSHLCGTGSATAQPRQETRA